MINEIKEFSKNIKNNVISYRRHIHQNPELSFQEFQTAQFIEAKLKEMGLEPIRIGETGVYAMIWGQNIDKSHCIGLRADMDALPIQEINSHDYISQNKGIMHACGHDAHSASLLGTAYILNQLKENLKGHIKLIFQPGEEKLPGGASILIKEGILKNPEVKFMIGQHVMPRIKTGHFGFRKGIYMASTDEIYITVKGKGGHGAMPQWCTDPVLVAAQIITQIQQVVSRKASPIVPTVLSFGKIYSEGGATNVIPNEVKIEGTLRTLDENWRNEAKNWIKQISKNTAQAAGAEVDINIVSGYPFLKNEEKITEKTIELAKEYLGNENVEDLDIWMAAEDFAYFSQEVPSTFYRMGTGNEDKKTTFSVHTNTFDIDEDAFENSVGLMAYVAMKLSNEI